MLLALSTWPEVEQYLRGSRGVLVPVGSTEQHGPTGLIGTDALCAEAVAQRAGERAAALVGPTIALTGAQFNLAFPGSISLRASTLMALVEDYVRSLAGQGFERFYFVNGHGANGAALKAAFHDLHGLRSFGAPRTERALRFRVRSWWEYPEVDALRRVLYGAGEGLHATPSEIAITQALYPGLKARPALPPAAPLTAEALKERTGDQHEDALSHRAEFPDGRVGSDSALATPEDGAKLLEAAVAALVLDYQAFMKDDA